MNISATQIDFLQIIPEFPAQYQPVRPTMPSGRHVTTLTPLFSFSEEKIAQNCKQDAQHYAGCDRKIETEIFSFDFYISRKLPEEIKFRHIRQHDSERYQYRTENDYDSCGFAYVHTKKITA